MTREAKLNEEDMDTSLCPCCCGTASVIFNSVFNKNKEAEVVRINGQAVKSREFSGVLV
jgi:hypothetical protein